MLKNSRIAKIELGNIPFIVVIVVRPLLLKELKFFYSIGIRLLEIRIDSFCTNLETIINFSIMAKETGFAIIATMRTESAISLEQNPSKSNFYRQNSCESSFNTRLDVLSQILIHADIVDLEIENETKYKEELISLAQKNDCRILLSVHDFVKTPQLEVMEAIIEEGMEYSSDFIKLAYFANSIDDCRRLLSFALNFQFRREKEAMDKQKQLPALVVIAMGDWGLISRITGMIVASPFTYAFVDQANALGQLSVSKMHEELILYYPSYREYIAKLKA